MSKSERFWDRAAKRFKGQVNEDDEAAITNLDHTRKYLQSNDIVLDFACATGKYSFEIAPQVKEVWGIDISTEMIAAAKRNAVERSVANVQFMQAEITDPRLEGESFNVILAYNILHLVEEPPQVVEKIKELLHDPDLQGTDLVAKGEMRDEGIGLIEAPRGTLFHHYKVNENGQVTMANLIVSTSRKKTDDSVSLVDSQST